MEQTKAIVYGVFPMEWFCKRIGQPEEEWGKTIRLVEPLTPEENAQFTELEKAILRFYAAKEAVAMQQANKELSIEEAQRALDAINLSFIPIIERIPKFFLSIKHKIDTEPRRK